MAFQMLRVYDYITRLCRQQTEVIQNLADTDVHNVGRGKAQHKKYKMLKLGCSQVYDLSSD
jgi:hypothetical protein